jgi:hypothetical protein
MARDCLAKCCLGLFGCRVEYCHGSGSGDVEFARFWRRGLRASPTNWAQQRSGDHPPTPNVREEDLGSSVLHGIDVHGYRRTLTLTAKASGTGSPS